MNENAIEPQAEKQDDIAILASGGIIEAARRAEQTVDAYKKIKSISLQLTNNNDWIDEGGKPYLQVSGAEKLRGAFGISWKIDEPSVDTFEDGHYSYAYQGEFSMAGQTITALGTRSSKDPFFSRKTKWVDGQKETIDTPPDQIDRASVKKGAYTNCIGNGLTRILGIRNLTWEELEASGIKPGGKVNFKGQDKPREGAAEGAADSRKISEAQGKRLFAISKKGGVSTEAMKAYLKDEFGIGHSRDINKDQYDKICAWAEAGGQEAPE